MLSISLSSRLFSFSPSRNFFTVNRRILSFRNDPIRTQPKSFFHPKNSNFTRLQTFNFCTENKEYFKIPFIEIEKVTLDIVKKYIENEEDIELLDKKLGYTSFKDLQFTRYEVMAIVVDLEDTFKVEIPKNIYNGFECVGNLVSYITTQPYVERNYDASQYISELEGPGESIYDTPEDGSGVLSLLLSTPSEPPSDPTPPQQE